MPYRYWYAILSVERKQYRIGPYSTRRTAERKARELFKGASPGGVSIVCEPGLKVPRRGRV
jgi:hypothetical protein